MLVMMCEGIVSFIVNVIFRDRRFPPIEWRNFCGSLLDFTEWLDVAVPSALMLLTDMHEVLVLAGFWLLRLVMVLPPLLALWHFIVPILEERAARPAKRTTRKSANPSHPPAAEPNPAGPAVAAGAVPDPVPLANPLAAAGSPPVSATAPISVVAEPASSSDALPATRSMLVSETAPASVVAESASPSSAPPAVEATPADAPSATATGTAVPFASASSESAPLAASATGIASWRKGAAASWRSFSAAAPSTSQQAALPDAPASSSSGGAALGVASWHGTIAASWRSSSSRRNASHSAISDAATPVTAAVSLPGASTGIASWRDGVAATWRSHSPAAVGVTQPEPQQPAGMSDPPGPAVGVATWRDGSAATWHTPAQSTDQPRAVESLPVVAGVSTPVTSGTAVAGPAPQTTETHARATAVGVASWWEAPVATWHGSSGSGSTGAPGTSGEPHRTAAALDNPAATLHEQATGSQVQAAGEGPETSAISSPGAASWRVAAVATWRSEGAGALPRSRAQHAFGDAPAPASTPQAANQPGPQRAGEQGAAVAPAAATAAGQAPRVHDREPPAGQPPSVPHPAPGDGPRGAPQAGASQGGSLFAQRGSASAATQPKLVAVPPSGVLEILLARLAAAAAWVKATVNQWKWARQLGRDIRVWYIGSRYGEVWEALVQSAAVRRLQETTGRFYRWLRGALAVPPAAALALQMTSVLAMTSLLVTSFVEPYPAQHDPTSASFIVFVILRTASLALELSGLGIAAKLAVAGARGRADAVFLSSQMAPLGQLCLGRAVIEVLWAVAIGLNLVLGLTTGWKVLVAGVLAAFALKASQLAAKPSQSGWWPPAYQWAFLASALCTQWPLCLPVIEALPDMGIVNEGNARA